MNLSPLCLFKANPEHVCRVHEPVAFSAVVICDILSWILNTLSHVRAKNNLCRHSRTLPQAASMHLHTQTHTHEISLFTSPRGVCSDKMWSSHWWLQLMCLHSSPVTRCGRAHTNTRGKKTTITRYVVHKFWKRKKNPRKIGSIY